MSRSAATAKTVSTFPLGCLTGSKVDRFARRQRSAEFLGELTSGRLPRVVAGLILTLGNRPRTVVLAGPERPAGMTDEDLDDLAAHPVQQHAGAQTSPSRSHGGPGSTAARSASASCAAAAIGQHVLQQQRGAVRSGQRHPPVRVLVGGARLVLGALARRPRRSAPGRAAATGPAQVPVERQDHLLLVGVRAEQPDPAQFGHPGRLLDAVVLQFVLGGPGEQAQGVAQPDVLAVR